MDNHLFIIGRFVKFLKRRLTLIKEDDRTCGKIVHKTFMVGSKTITGAKRCLGYISNSEHCYYCGPRTGFVCPECGDDVESLGKFCSWECRYKYWK